MEKHTMAMQAQQVQDATRVEVRTRFGTLPVPKENLLTFPQGIPGFDHLYRFALFHDEDNNSIHYLQSLDDPAVRLPLTSPRWFNIDYQFTLSDEEIRLLDIEPADEVSVLVVLAEQDEGKPPRLNLHGPIILNTSKRLGLQKVLNQPRGSLVISAH
ncbi:MAG: flagellar biosynthesis protein FliW [Gammaproteobacteria bacterium]|nr:MAG: flagellar biosynthesis protein FliW [Gammaproteobacteria bacterium]